jgi:hypothetical protein
VAQNADYGEVFNPGDRIRGRVAGTEWFDMMGIHPESRSVAIHLSGCFATTSARCLAMLGFGCSCKSGISLSTPVGDETLLTFMTVDIHQSGYLRVHFLPVFGHCWDEFELDDGARLFVRTDPIDVCVAHAHKLAHALVNTIGKPLEYDELPPLLLVVQQCYIVPAIVVFRIKVLVPYLTLSRIEKSVAVL